jgi:DNA-binding transcriptional regulator YiaG
MKISGSEKLMIIRIPDGEVLTPDGFRNLLEEIGLSQHEAARVLGVTVRTARRWARGDLPIPDEVHALLVAMKQGASSEDIEDIETIDVDLDMNKDDEDDNKDDNKNDKGLTFGIAYDPSNHTVRLEFARPIMQLAFPPDQAEEFARIILNYVTISKEYKKQ